MKKFFKKIGRINTALILTLVYFLVLPVFRIVLILQNRRHKDFDSTWKNREPVYPNSHEHYF